MLIKCSECEKEVSDQAKTCPNCGNPINNSSQSEDAKILNEFLNAESQPIEYEKKSWILGGGEWTKEEIEKHEAMQKEWWYNMKFFWLTKQSGVIGQIILGLIFTVLLQLAVEPDTQIGKYLTMLVAFCPFLYVNKYSNKINKIMVWAVYLLLVCGTIATYFGIKI